MRLLICVAFIATLAYPARADDPEPVPTIHYYVPGPYFYCFGKEPPKGEKPDPKLCVQCPQGKDPVILWPDGSKAEKTISKWNVRDDLEGFTPACEP